MPTTVAACPRPAAILALVLAAAVAMAAGPDPVAAAPAWQDSLQAQLAAGRLEAALTTARQATGTAGGHAALWMNLAGLEQRVGDPQRAASALRQAVVHGFDDFRHADHDPDLADLTRTEAYRELREAWAAGLAARAEARTVTLTAGRWSPPLPLPDQAGGLTPPQAQVQLRAGARALEVAVEVSGSTELTRAPWRGGGGVLVAVGPAHDPAESRAAVEVAAGLADDLPAGAVRLGRRWQRLAELTPKLRVLSAGVLRYEFAIPWPVCDPWHPVVDDPLLINVTVVTEEGGRQVGRAAWLEDPAAGRPDRVWRRGVPVQVTWPPASGPLLHGRLASTLIRDDTLTLRSLAAVVPGAGPAAARLVLRDRHGEVAWSETLPLPGGAGRREVSLSAPLDVPVGSLKLGATLDGAGPDAAATWQTDLVHLPPDWLSQARIRVAAAPAAERPSLTWRLEAVAAAAANPAPGASAGALGTTLDEVQTLLARLEVTGSSLPAGGPYLAAAPEPAGDAWLPCSLALPDGWRPGDPATVVLLLARAPGAADRAVTLAPRLLAERAERAGVATPPVVLAYPHLPTDHDPRQARSRAAVLVDWLRRFLGSGPVHVAGVDLLAATALEVAAERPADVAAVLALTGVGFVPYPNDDDAALADRLAGLDPALTVGWYWFPDEQQPGDQAAIMRRALRDRGLTLDPARAVAGGLDATQAWMRSVVWAAGLGP